MTMQAAAAIGGSGCCLVIPPPRRDRAHRLHWSIWRGRHQHRARQAHQRWNAYAETAA